MAKTLQNILEDIGAYIDQDTTLPSGVEESVRINLVDQALQEWGAAYQWKQLRNVATVPFTYSGTSVGLPGNFKKMMSPVYDIAQAIGSQREYDEIMPSTAYVRLDTDKYITIGGDPGTGHYMNINPAMNSGFSGSYHFQSFPSSMATLSDVCVCPDYMFIVKRVSGLIFESRSDSRFPQLKADADLLLQRMIEEEQATSGAMKNKTQTWTSGSGFVMGEE